MFGRGQIAVTLRGVGESIAVALMGVSREQGVVCHFIIVSDRMLASVAKHLNFSECAQIRGEEGAK